MFSVAVLFVGACVKVGGTRCAKGGGGGGEEGGEGGREKGGGGRGRGVGGDGEGDRAIKRRRTERRGEEEGAGEEGSVHKRVYVVEARMNIGIHTCTHIHTHTLGIVHIRMIAHTYSYMHHTHS